MGTHKVSDGDFNVLQFEKQLINLKDSQEAINTCCQWCLQNRIHHKKIVNSWLNVLRRVKVEQRLVLFYLANDVVQYSKRRNFDYVESWGIALQKATTMVRDDKVKHKILRIFKIWEQRNVYNEEFISDLCGLLSVLPSAPKNDEPHEFQPNYVINKIKTCAKLEKDTDIKLKLLKEHNPKIHIDDGLIASLKDRAHMDDVEKEVEVYIKHMEDYINALKLEIKNRITVIGVLKQAETQLEADRKDVKVVANAYKMFGTRVKTFQRKLEEHKLTLSSPVPSPDVNAPSPSPDSDIDLPEESVDNSAAKETSPAAYNPKSELQYGSNYYPPAASDTSDVGSTFLSANGFSSFIGSETFNLENFNSSLFSNLSNFTNSNESAVEDNYAPSKTSASNPPLPVEAPSTQPSYSYGSSHVPLLPPPMPPFSKSEEEFVNTGNYEVNYSSAESSAPFENTFTTSSYETNSNYPSNPPSFPQEDSFEPPVGANPYPPSDEYNPEDDVTTWEPDASWNGGPPPPTDTDTPESPPLFEKEGYSDPVEYHENIISTGALDVDHRVIPGVSNDMDDSMNSSLGAKDVDHRNLISLTGSPGHSNSQNSASDSLWNHTDQDYRVTPQNVCHPHLPTPPISSVDQDYRLGFNLDQLKLPPPPPPPPKYQEEQEQTTGPITDSSIDMDLSDDEGRQHKNDNLKVIVDGQKKEEKSKFMLEPPPPLPELPEDVDANIFLDDLSNDINDFVGDDNNDNPPLLLPLPPLMNFNNLVGPPLMPPINTSVPNMNTTESMHTSAAGMNSSMTMNSSMNPMNTSMPPMNTSMPPINTSIPPMNTSMPPPPPLQPPPMMSGMSMGPPPNAWMGDDEHGDINHRGLNEEWKDDGYSELEHMNNWMGPTPMMPPPEFGGFRGRGNNRGNFIKRGRGRGGNFNQNQGQNFNQGGNFRGNFRGARGGNRGGNRGFFRGNFRGNFQRSGF